MFPQWKTWQSRHCRDEYKPLAVDSTENVDEEGVHQLKPGRANLVLTYASAILRVTAQSVLFGVIIYAVMTLARQPSSGFVTQSGPVSCSCGGTTTAEAVRRGCIFTPLAIAWLPPHCIDMELSVEFDEAGPDGKWEYWKDLNATAPMTREEMGLLADSGGVFYTTQEWHIAHCMYTWRKHYRSKLTGTIIENRSNGIRHIEHCEGVMRIRQPLEAIFTEAGIELNADLV